MSTPAARTAVKTLTCGVARRAVANSMAAQKDVASAGALPVIPVGAMSQVTELPARETIVGRSGQKDSEPDNDISALHSTMHQKPPGLSHCPIQEAGELQRGPLSSWNG